MKMRAPLGLSLVAAAVAVLACPAPAAADPAGDKIVAEVDAAMNRAKTHKFDYEIINQEPGKSERTMAMRVQIKAEKRLTEFSAPADMKGTKVLILSPTQMYVYLPAFGKVRRIASHTKDQGFLGLAFSQDDMAQQAYGSDYESKLAGEDGASWKLVLTPRAGKETSYAKIEATIAKDKKVPTELKYFNAEGKNIKTETRTGYTCEGDVCTPGELKMTDNAKGNWTKLVRKSWKVNENISDDVFSQRSLGE
ncbi:Outer membrane lipoprotein-sorting protein [Minicystis rosea]|nr:Outer membrane lipoprotein-sorting protein [Minicystis rosea]